MKRVLIACVFVVLPNAGLASTALEVGTSPIIGVAWNQGHFSAGVGGDVLRYSQEAFTPAIDGSGNLVNVRVHRQYTVFTPTILLRYFLTRQTELQPHVTAKLSKGIPSHVEGYDFISSNYGKQLDDYSLAILGGLRTRLRDRLSLGGEAGMRLTWLTPGLGNDGTLLKGEFDVFLQLRL